MNKKILKIYFGVLLLLLIIVYICCRFSESKIFKENYITFNKKSGFYNDSIKVKIKKDLDLPIGTKIYYTLDGNTPTNKSMEYKKPIELKKKSITAIYPLKVVAYKDGQYSDIIQRTYVIDKDINNNKTNIISITSDNKNLYDYNTGILVPGATFAKNQENEQGYISGNYSLRDEKWIKKSEIVMFDKDGKELLNQDIGLGISGGTSSQLPIKSLKLISNYNSNKKFNFNFYNKNQVGDYSFVNEYSSLRLRSGLQDSSALNIRSSISSRLIQESNFDGYSTTERAIVFINGKFYGLFEIQQPFSKSFIKNKYVLPDSSKIKKYKRIEQIVLPKLNVEKYLKADLSQEENREKLEKVIDMDNYLNYYAIEILLNNNDWPKNNFQAWNYIGEVNENNKYTDGRYRFLIYDMDVIYHYEFLTEVNPKKIKTDVFESFMKNEYNSENSSFQNILKTKYYRDKYIMITEDLLNTSFKRSNILKIADEEYNKVIKDHEKYYKEYERIFAENKKYFDDDFFDKKFKIFIKRYITKIKNVDHNYEKLIYEIKERNDDLESNFKKYFDLDKKHKVTIESTEGIQINFSNQELYQNEKYTNKYYTGIDLRYNYKEYPGYKFKYWLVNDKKIYDKELVIDDDYEDVEEIEIKVVSEYIKKDNHLLITEIYPNGDSDWIKITNTGKEKIKLEDYYLSDNDKKLKKYNLPSKTLKPNESIIVNGKSNYYSIGDYICNFNLKKEENIYLSKEDKIVDKVYVPRTSDIETYGRYKNSNTFKFFVNENNNRKE